MVYRKRSYKRKRPMRSRKRMNISRPRAVTRYNGASIVRMKRTFYYTNWVPSTTSTTDFWKYFQLTFQDLPNYAELTAMFDTYKINGIKLTLRPRYDGFAGNDTTDVTLPGTTAQGLTTVHVIKDPMSSTTPSGAYTKANLNTFLENGAVKSYTGTRPINIYYKPTITNLVEGSATNRTSAKWLSTGAVGITVPHYGCHVFLQDNNLTGVFNQGFDVFVTYYFQVKGLR